MSLKWKQKANWFEEAEHLDSHMRWWWSEACFLDGRALEWHSEKNVQDRCQNVANNPMALNSDAPFIPGGKIGPLSLSTFGLYPHFQKCVYALHFLQALTPTMQKSNNMRLLSIHWVCIVTRFPGPFLYANYLSYSFKIIFIYCKICWCNQSMGPPVNDFRVWDKDDINGFTSLYRSKLVRRYPDTMGPWIEPEVVRLTRWKRWSLIDVTC